MSLEIVKDRAPKSSETTMSRKPRACLLALRPRSSFYEFNEERDMRTIPIKAKDIPIT